MNTRTFPGSRLVLAGLLLSGAAIAQTAPGPDAALAPPRAAAADPALKPPPAPPTGASTTVTGRVARWLPNPNGEVDGLLLDDGTQVNFPPHLSSRMIAAVKLRDTVQVTGRASPTSQTPPVLRATLIKASSSGQTIGDEPSAGGPPTAPRDHAALTAMKESGRITTLLHTGRGDVNGVVLDSGTVVRFPPHAGAQFASVLKPSGTLYAQGYGTRNAQGSAFEATQIGASESAAQTVFPGPRGPGGRPPGPGADGPRPPAEGARPSPPPLSDARDAASAPR